jgi:MFS family permease
MTAFIILGFPLGTWIARLPDIKRSIHLTDGQLGTSLFFVAIGVVGTLRPAGWLCARLGSARLLKSATVAMLVTVPLIAIPNTEHQLWLAFFIYGVAQATMDVAMNTHASTLEQRVDGRIMSTMHAMFSVGMLAGAALGGLSAQLQTPLAATLIATSCLALGGSFFARSRFLPTELDIHVVERHKREKFPRLLIAMGILGMAGSICEGASADWGTVLARDAFHASPFIATLPYIIFSIAMILGRLTGDKLAERFGAARLITFSGLIAALGLSGGLMIGHIYGAIIGWLCIGAGVSTVIPLLFSAAGTLAHNKYSGSISPSGAIALVSGVSYFGFVVGAPIIGHVADAISLRWAMLIPAGLALLLSIGARQVLSE